LGVVAKLKGGDTKTVLLRDITVNGGLDEATAKLLQIKAPDGWQRDIRPWRKPQA